MKNKCKQNYTFILFFRNKGKQSTTEVSRIQKNELEDQIDELESDVGELKTRIRRKLKEEKDEKEREKEEHEMHKKSILDENVGLQLELKKILTTINN